MATKSRLGEMLVKDKLITDAQLAKAQEFQKAVGGTLSQILVKLGFVTDEKLTEFIAKKQNLHIADLDNMFLPENLIKRVPRKLVEEEQVVPIAFKDGVLTIASSDPTDLEAIEKIAFATGFKVEMQLASRAAITRALSRAFYQAEDKPKPVGAKSKEELLKDLTQSFSVSKPAKVSADEVSSPDLSRALIPLLIEKGIITEEDLRRKARELASRGVTV